LALSKSTEIFAAIVAAVLIPDAPAASVVAVPAAAALSFI